MHIHAMPGSIDSLLTVDKIFETALRKGLGAVAVSDHNSYRGTAEALSKARPDLTVIPAVEASTEMGHMLCYFVSRAPADAGIKPKDGLYPFSEVRRFVEEEGGLLIAAHPFRGRHSRILEIADSIDGIEVFNGRNASRYQRGNDAADAVAKTMKFRFTAGSDAHTATEIGRAYRIFEFEKQPTAEDIRAALENRSGKYYGKYSPLCAEAYSGMRHYIRTRDPKSFIRRAGKFALGMLLDPLKGVREDTRLISRGKEYEL